MENDPSIDDFPIKTSIYKGFSMAMLNNQMVDQPQDHTPQPHPRRTPISKRGGGSRRAATASATSGSKPSRARFNIGEKNAMQNYGGWE